MVETVERSCPGRRTSVLPWLSAVALLVGAACAPAMPAAVGAPAADPAGTAAELVRLTTTAGPQRITFTWALNEGASRVSGRGVVRADVPERIRLDLFGQRNESYLAAALVGDTYRLPQGITEQVALPSPALLWGGLGVIRPPSGATLAEASVGDGAASVRYRTPEGSDYLYVTRGSGAGTRLESLERIERGSRVESIRLTRDDAGRISRAEYRNWAAYRELILDIEEANNVAAFPESTWQP